MPITGTVGNDTLSGTSGNDTIIGLAGDDDLTGGAGNDTYLFNNSFGDDIVREGGGNPSSSDIINVGGLNISGNAIAYGGGYLFGDVFITVPGSGGLLLARGSDSILLSEWDSNGDYGITLTNLPSGTAVYGTSGNDNIGTSTTDPFGNPIYPNLGPGTQHYYGQGGNDTAFGEGFDVLFGGDGNDQLTAASGSLIIFGENDNDTLLVGGGNHTVYGGSGDDWIYAYSNIGGNSFLSGGDGNDVLGFYYHTSYTNYNIGNNTFLGGAGNDVFHDPYSHNDTLIGGTGNDLYIFYTTSSLSHGHDVVIDEDGSGTLAYRIYSTPTSTVLGGSSYTGTISGTAGQLNASQWQITTADGTFTLTMSGDDLVITSTINASQSITVRNFVNGQYGITLDNTPVTPGVIYGTSGADSINGTSGNDTIDGLGGSDRINGLDGDDSIMGSGDTDTIEGGLGADTIDGGANSGDVAEYKNSNAGVSVNLATNVNTGGHAQGDSLSNIEKVWGSLYADTIVGNTGDNYLFGRAGNDSIEGGDGNDSLDGGVDGDTLDGGNGTDQVDYRYSTAAVSVNLHTGAASGGYAQGDTLSNIEDLLGSDYNDTLAGSLAANVIDGGAGTDTMVYTDSNAGVTVNLTTNSHSGGHAAADSLLNIENVTGSAFADSITGTSGNNVLDGGAGVDTLVGGAGNDTYYVDSSSDVVTENASEGTDTVISTASRTLSSNVENLTLGGSGNIDGTGNSLNNVITGNAGNNSLNGGSGNDTITGGAGNDTLEGGAGADNIDGGADIDTLSYAGSSSAVYVHLGNSIFSDGDAAGDTVSNVEIIVGSAYNDTITGYAVDNMLFGGLGHDYLFGGNGNDTIEGGDGNDTILGGKANDTLTGGSGDDTFEFSDLMGTDVINDFTGAGSVGGDVLRIQSNLGSNGITDWSSLSSHISYVGGNAIIDLGSGYSVTLVGVTSLSSGDVVFY